MISRDLGNGGSRDLAVRDMFSRDVAVDPVTLSTGSAV